jgi:hypothetical protein
MNYIPITALPKDVCIVSGLEERESPKSADVYKGIVMPESNGIFVIPVTVQTSSSEKAVPRGFPQVLRMLG